MPPAADPKLRRHLTAARREVTRAVDTASGVDLRRGHYIEAARRARAVRDAANDLLKLLEETL